MIKKYSLVFIALLCSFFYGFGQLNITLTNTDYTIDFDNTISGVNNGAFSGLGWQPTPVSGRLDSDAWAHTGMSDGNLNFGGTGINGDYARGSGNFGFSTTGGWYAFNNPGNGVALGCQPGGSDWTPGTLTLRIQNNTGNTLNSLNIDYDIVCYNNQPRANSFNFSHSSDNITYSPEATLNYTSPATATSTTIVSPKNISISGLSISNGSYYYLRWNGDDSSGSGSRDQFAIDNIVINVQGGVPNYSVTYNGNGSTGGTVPTDGNAYNSGDTVTVLANTGSLTNTCSTFNNWNTASDGSGTSFSAGNTFNITANTTLYAQWVSTNHTVTFNNNGGSGTMTPQTACTATNLSPNTFTRAGFTFDKWNTAANGSGTDYADNASYNFSSDVTLYAQWIPIPSCSELMISEYVEGSSNNKYIEIYNPTSGSIDLSNYRLVQYNGTDTTPTYTLALSGTLLSYDTFVIANNQATIFTGTIDLATNQNIMNFNGDDPMALQTSGGVNIDVIGIIGSNTNFGQNTTLRRKSTIQNPNITYAVSEWDSYGQDIIDLGNHISDCQGSTPEIQLVDSTSTNQNCGFSIDFGTQALSSNTDLTFDIENVGSADLDISSFGITGDYTIVSPTAPLTITSGNSQTVTVRFIPSVNGTRNGVITINNNDSNESACTVNLTGVGFTPTPEIDVERNTGGSIPNGSAANAGYNTIFASTTIGNTTAPKTYHVANEGTANLTLTSIISSNPTEFSISLNPAPITINPNTEVDFEIIFSPIGIGLRTATITIVSNDADENPYTFNVQGNGDCASGTLTFLPDNGPVGTIVNVTSSTSNFGGSTTALIGGIPATVTVISVNEIEVTIPAGASTGSIQINDDLGCLSSGLFTVIDELISSCEGSSGLTPTDLFISEVTDKGTGSHSYVEIYNGTGATISLNTYEVRIHNNGATNATTTIPLSGTIANDGIVVIGFGGTNAMDPEGGYTADFFSGGGGINEDDHIRLYDGANWIDLWGDTSGNPFTIASKDYTYRRKNSGIIVPSTTWNLNDWEAFTPVDYSDIGNFDFSIGVSPTVTSGPTISYSCNTASISVTGSEGYNSGGDTKELAYQWYYSAPGDIGWTEVPDNAIYDNPTTATLDILDTSALEKYQFYCQIREDDQYCYEASDAVQLTLPTTIWTGTWSSPPTSGKIAIINANYNTGNGTGGQTSFEACSLIINANYTLTISNTTYVNIVNNVTNHGTINIQTQGSFVQRGDGAAAGTFTNSGAGVANVAKTTAEFDSRISLINYTYWSSPINDPSNPGFGEDISTVFQTPFGNRKYFFTAQNYIDSFIETGNNNATIPGHDDIDDNGDDWSFASGAMEIGRGYAVTASGLPPTPGIFRDASTVFSGALNTGDITVTLYKNNNEINDNNWNFIGNPYPSSISVDDFFSANIDDVPLNPAINGLTEGAIFLWSQSLPPDSGNNGNEAINFAQSDYAIINRAAATSGTSGEVPLRYIPSGQGFFVAFTENLSTNVNSITTGNVIFTNSMRRTGDNTQFFEANDGSQNIKATDSNNVYEKNILWLNMSSDNGVFSQIAVAYVNGATDAYDGWSFDTPRNLSTGTYAMLYSVIDSSERQFAIQGKSPESLTLNEVVALGFDTSIDEATLYKFSIPQLEGSFMNQNDIFIKDNLLNKTHNLKESDYSFTSEVGEFTDRFEIVFTEDALSVGEVKIDKNTLQIIELPNGDVQFKVSSQYEMKSIEIVDLLGRTLYQLDAQGNSQTFSLSNLSQATYFAKVKLSNGYVITKKAIKRK
ncbi:MAG: InlB B-repeat-containing protein [Flavobacteriaceae bacterium]|nr:InlB B-repeat-containing protein [Flavobacteriaceae bacterium]